MQEISISHSTFQSPIGNLYLGTSLQGLCCIAWNSTSWNRFLENARKRFDITLKNDNTHFTGFEDDLENYFAGTLRHFTAAVDLFALSQFEQKVLKAAQNISYGTVQTYRELARTVGSPHASRAVGNALGKNPVPIVIPCHRIVKSDGTLGGFAGGLDIKRFLLQLESVHDHQLPT